MSMRFRVLALLGALLLPWTAGAQEYRLSGKWYTAKWTGGAWHGEHKFPGVYCMKFPGHETALELGYGMFNDGAIFLTQVLYPEKTAAFVTVSTVPAGRSADDEVTRLAGLEKQAEAAYRTPYNITEMETAFGRTIGLRIKDVAPASRAGPFPLVRAMIRPPREPIETLSVHRLFVRGPDRFEIATLQLAPADANAATEAQMTQHLTRLADEIVGALQSCTASLPVRAPR